MGLQSCQQPLLGEQRITLSDTTTGAARSTRPPEVLINAPARQLRPRGLRFRFAFEFGDEPAATWSTGAVAGRSSPRRCAARRARRRARRRAPAGAGRARRLPCASRTAPRDVLARRVGRAERGGRDDARRPVLARRPPRCRRAVRRGLLGRRARGRPRARRRLAAGLRRASRARDLMYVPFTMSPGGCSRDVTRLVDVGGYSYHAPPRPTTRSCYCITQVIEAAAAPRARAPRRQVPRAPRRARRAARATVSGRSRRALSLSPSKRGRAGRVHAGPRRALGPRRPAAHLLARRARRRRDDVRARGARRAVVGVGRLHHGHVRLDVRGLRSRDAVPRRRR